MTWLAWPTRPYHAVSFNQIYLSKPMVTEADGMTSTLFPKEARLRNLTYSAPLYVDMEKRVTTISPEGDETVEEEKINKAGSNVLQKPGST